VVAEASANGVGHELLIVNDHEVTLRRACIKIIAQDEPNCWDNQTGDKDQSTLRNEWEQKTAAKDGTDPRVRLDDTKSGGEQTELEA